jgi:hypothetical protein
MAARRKNNQQIANHLLFQRDPFQLIYKTNNELLYFYQHWFRAGHSMNAATSPMPQR